MSSQVALVTQYRFRLAHAQYVQIVRILGRNINLYCFWDINISEYSSVPIVSSKGALVAIPLPLFHITSSRTSKSLYNLLTHFKISL